MARGLAFVISGGFPISELPDGFRFWGAGTIAAFLFLSWLLSWSCRCLIFFDRTTLGRDVYAIGGNKQAAMFSGIPLMDG